MLPVAAPLPGKLVYPCPICSPRHTTLAAATAPSLPAERARGRPGGGGGAAVGGAPLDRGIRAGAGLPPPARVAAGSDLWAVRRRRRSDLLRLWHSTGCSLAEQKSCSRLGVCVCMGQRRCRRAACAASPPRAPATRPCVRCRGVTPCEWLDMSGGMIAGSLMVPSQVGLCWGVKVDAFGAACFGAGCGGRQCRHLKAPESTFMPPQTNRQLLLAASPPDPATRPSAPPAGQAAAAPV